jgi:Rad3-related DNA helicase
MVGELAAASDGRALVLFTSYASLENCARSLRKMLAPYGIEVLAQREDGSRESLLERLREGGRTVLLGTSSFWEGIDVRGDALSLLVIAKLPFAVFTDPVIQGRCELLEAAGKDSFMNLSVPQAVLRLRQGFGRLIRSKSDRGVAIIADKRVLTRRYGGAFLRALPARAQPISDPLELVGAVREFLNTAQEKPAV